MNRDECWFLDCGREPVGDLHGDNGFSVAACESHGVTGEAFGWERFERWASENTEDSDR